HRLDREDSILLDPAREHVFAERFPVARGFPELQVHELGRIDLAVTGRGLPLAQELHERLKQRPALRVPERRADGLVLEVKEIHLPAELAVIAPLGLLEPLEVRLELLRLGPSRAVDALQHLVARVAAPIRAGELRQLEREPEAAGRRQVRAPAQVDEVALPVQADRLIARDAGDDLGLVVLADAAKELDRAIAIPDLAHDRLVALDDLAHALLDALEILRRERLVAGEIVVEAVLDRRADRDLRL